jgi:L-lactate utilization protein LutC
MTSRESVLQKVRGALGRSAGQQPPPLPSPLVRVPDSDKLHNANRFVTAFEKLAGKTFRVGGTGDVAGAVRELLAGKRAIASNAAYLRECGLLEMPNVESGVTDREQLREACSTADIGITSADYVLADTGTLVMLSSPQEARLISLLPPIHLAVFSRERILSGLDELMALLPLPAEQTSAMVFITGPSRTADIEQILVRGVHGPGEIYAVIVG